MVPYSLQPISFTKPTRTMFSLNYSRRINRPGLASLNPFAYYTNIYTYSTGNPLLLPSYSNNFELNYLYKSMFSFTVFTQHTSDVNSLLTTIEGPLVVSSRGNFLTRDNVGAYISFNRAFFNWWENSSSASFFYSSSESKIEAIPIQNGTSASFSVNNNFKATKLLNFYLNYSQSLPSTSGNTYTYSQRDFRVGARLKLLNNNLIINPSYFLGTVNKYDVHVLANLCRRKEPTIIIKLLVLVLPTYSADQRFPETTRTYLLMRKEELNSNMI
jgi:outer membrane receptor protein involved in Fe transport